MCVRLCVCPAPSDEPSVSPPGTQRLVSDNLKLSYSAKIICSTSVAKAYLISKLNYRLTYITKKRIFLIILTFYLLENTMNWCQENVGFSNLSGY